MRASAKKAYLLATRSIYEVYYLLKRVLYTSTNEDLLATGRRLELRAIEMHVGPPRRDDKLLLHNDLPFARFCSPGK